MATEMAPSKLQEGIVVVEPFGEAPFKPQRGHWCNRGVSFIISSQHRRPIESKKCSQILFYAYVVIHQVIILVFDNYQRCPVPLNLDSTSMTFLMKEVGLYGNRRFVFIDRIN